MSICSIILLASFFLVHILEKQQELDYLTQLWEEKIMEMERVYLDELFDEMIWQVRETGTKVIQYRYRTAMPRNILMKLPRYKGFEELLAEKAKKNLDNHTVYQVTLSDGNSFVVFCHDFKMYIGLGVDVVCW